MSFAPWLSDVFSLVEAEDVRRVFLSHDDVDHTGNLDQLMTACPNARLVCNWAMVERHTNCFSFPLNRCRWVMHEESFDIGDRTLHAVRPPVYDSPTTRGLFDPKTGVYWAVDSFATALPDPEMAVADLDPDFWQFGMTMFAFGAVSPWLSLVDHHKYGRYIDTVQGLDITPIAGCHTPVLEGELIPKAFSHTRSFPSVEPPPLPNQSILDQIIAATAQPVSGFPFAACAPLPGDNAPSTAGSSPRWPPASEVAAPPAEFRAPHSRDGTRGQPARVITSRATSVIVRSGPLSTTKSSTAALALSASSVCDRARRKSCPIPTSR